MRRLWAGAAALVLAAALAPAWLAHHFPEQPWWLLRSLFRGVCHQRPERSLWLWGSPVAVCMRCLGIYVGALAGTQVRVSVGPARRLLLASVLGCAMDVAVEWAGLHGSWPWVRFGLGWVLGLAVSAFVLAEPRTKALASRAGGDEGTVLP